MPTKKVMRAITIGYQRPSRCRRWRPPARKRQSEEAAEPAVADVVRQRHRGVADLGREQLDQQGADRAVDHGHEDDQDSRRRRITSGGVDEAGSAFAG